VIIGHEISHGFDDQGSQYEAQGRLANWWTDDDLKKFGRRPPVWSTSSKAISSSRGFITTASWCWARASAILAGRRSPTGRSRSRRRRRPGRAIDGFTPDQQFIAWSQARYDNTRPETQRLMVQSDPHPVSKYRVIGPLSNLPEFQKAFGCKPESAMVRPAADRCEVW
jgi:endothelin-converting enzyme/putative endopeptidase